MITDKDKISLYLDNASKYFDLASKKDIKKYYLQSANWSKKVLKLDPNNLDALITGGGALSNAGRYKKALVLLNKAIILSKKKSTDLEYALVNKAITLMNLAEIIKSESKRNKTYREALKYFNKALKINPKRIHTNINKWNILNELEIKNREYYNLLDKVISNDPNNYYALWAKAEDLMHIQKFKLALNYWKKALNEHISLCLTKKCPDKYIFYNNIGICFGKLKKKREALSFFDKAIKINPKGLDSLYNKAKTLYELKKYQKSILMYKRILKFRNLTKKDRGDIMIWVTRGYVALNNINQMLIYMEKICPNIKDTKKYNQLIELIFK